MFVKKRFSEKKTRTLGIFELDSKQRYMSIFRRYIVIPFKEIKGPKAVKKPFPATSM